MRPEIANRLCITGLHRPSTVSRLSTLTDLVIFQLSDSVLQGAELPLVFNLLRPVLRFVRFERVAMGTKNSGV